MTRGRLRGALPPRAAIRGATASGPYERAKYDATLRACGRGPFEARAGAGRLDRRVQRAAGAALPAADDARRQPGRRRAARACGSRAHRSIRALLGAVPADLPRGPFDLVVASEVLYYLPCPAFDATVAALRERIVPGGRLVAVHYAAPGPERPLTAAPSTPCCAPSRG